MSPETPLFFATPAEFRTWLHKNHASQKVQWIGYYKKATKTPSMTWSESVDQALCYGWIDGLRKTIDNKSYKIRFTPRKVKSNWSKVNLDKMDVLTKENLMMPSGLAIYKKRTAKSTIQAAYEQGTLVLDPIYESQIKANSKAWDYYTNKLTPSYKKVSIHWVMSAKQKSTRQKRLGILITAAAEGLMIPQIQKYRK
jgi:uncharacterized protein YdeI (YjbR/CyaY-like superfamily)